MNLRIVTPLDVPVDEDGVSALRAEDPSGGFGILQGHADFLTCLVTGVVRWTARDGTQRFCAVRRGQLFVTGGTAISITTREAVIGTDLTALEHNVLARFQADLDTERAEKVSSTQLELRAIRQIVDHLNPAGRNFQ
jgi:F-type H+-transporting ATPase subunit epsilon